MGSSWRCPRCGVSFRNNKSETNMRVHSDAPKACVMFGWRHCILFLRTPFMRVFLKSITIIPLLALYVLISLGLMALPAGRARRRERLMANTSCFARLGLRVLQPIAQDLDEARGQERLARPQRGQPLQALHHQALPAGAEQAIDEREQLRRRCRGALLAPGPRPAEPTHAP